MIVQGVRSRFTFADYFRSFGPIYIVFRPLWAPIWFFMKINWKLSFFVQKQPIMVITLWIEWKLAMSMSFEKNQYGRHDLPAAIMDYGVKMKNWDLFFFKEYIFTNHFHPKKSICIGIVSKFISRPELWGREECRIEKRYLHTW